MGVQLADPGNEIHGDPMGQNVLIWADRELGK